MPRWPFSRKKSPQNKISQTTSFQPPRDTVGHSNTPSSSTGHTFPGGFSTYRCPSAESQTPSANVWTNRDQYTPSAEAGGRQNVVPVVALPQPSIPHYQSSQYNLPTGPPMPYHTSPSPYHNTPGYLAISNTPYESDTDSESDFESDSDSYPSSHGTSGSDPGSPYQSIFTPGTIAHTDSGRPTSHPQQFPNNTPVSASWMGHNSSALAVGYGASYNSSGGITQVSYVHFQGPANYALQHNCVNVSGPGNVISVGSRVYRS